MIIEHVTDCKSYFGFPFNQIKPGIHVKMLSWNVFEDVEINEETCKDVLNLAKTYRIYLFSSRFTDFQITFSDKYFKLWKYVIRDYNLKPVVQYEDKIEVKDGHFYYGFCEIDYNQIINALNFLQRYSSSSYIVLSRTELSFNDMNSNIGINNALWKENNMWNVYNPNIMNEICRTGGVVINSCYIDDGFTIRIFYKNI